MSESLYIYKASGKQPLDEAVAACQTALGAETYALLYAAQDCYFARVDGEGQLYRMQLDGEKQAYRETIDAAGIYEARLFNGNAELRWLHRERGQGDAVVLANTDDLNVFGPLSLKEVIAGHIDQRYLLWGEGTGAEVGEGWSQLSTARIGAYVAPIGGIGANQRAQLTAIEYLKTYDYGNVGVFEERLTGLQPEGKEPSRG